MAILKIMFLFCAPLFVFFLCIENGNEKKMFKVVIGDYDSIKGPIAPLSICPTGNGGFLGRQGERVTDEDLKGYFSTFLMDGRANLLLRFENEKNISILDLSNILSRLKKLANEKVETTIYIKISGI